MKNLYEIILESNTLYNIFFTNPEDALNYFKNNIHNSSKVSDTIISDFVYEIYNIWKIKLNETPTSVPFRFSNNAVKIARVYKLYIKDIDKIPEVKITNSDIKLGKYISIKFGDGSIGGNRAEKGLDLEIQTINQICNFIRGLGGELNLKENDLKTIFPDGTYDNLFNMYLQGGFNDLIELFNQNPNIDLYKYVVSTGKQDTKRNKSNELFDKNFNINTTNTREVLYKSGNIISDITIKTKNPTYISIKMKSAQLSGVNFMPAFYNKSIQTGIENGETWDSIKNNADVIPFINFLTTIGLNPEQIYNIYVDIFKGNPGKKIKITGDYNSEKLGVLIQKLLGGNYWYVSPAVSIWVTDKPAKLNIKLDYATISDTGNSIIVNGTVNNVKMSLVFRTSNADKNYPYRLFPRLNVKQLIQTFK